ncbi:hypothetical protein KJ644_05025 [Candidatus Dependentiae bacterium]|nr:hypothetical protein [Candidatus Dependentiae bacterium]
MLKEIEWRRSERAEFETLKGACNARHLISSGLSFALMGTKLNVHFQYPSFIDKLRDKFDIFECRNVEIPEMFFVDKSRNPRQSERGGNYGYVSQCGGKAVVFSNEFGIFKSVINGFASYLVASVGYVPVHASIVEVNGHGILFTGGYHAGKTTVLINFIDDLIRAGDSVKVLTDDWAVVRQESGCYVAKTFDPSISLRFSDLQDNPQLVFAGSEHLKWRFGKMAKISLHPDDLYGMDCSTEAVKVRTIVLLTDETRTSVITTAIRDDEPRAIINAAYHYPYVDVEQVAKHMSFWNEAIEKLRFVSFAHGNSGDKVKNINRLRKEIL